MTERWRLVRGVLAVAGVVGWAGLIFSLGAFGGSNLQATVGAIILGFVTVSVVYTVLILRTSYSLRTVSGVWSGFLAGLGLIWLLKDPEPPWFGPLFLFGTAVWNVVAARRFSADPGLGSHAGGK